MQISTCNNYFYPVNLGNQENHGSDNLPRATYNVQFVSAKQGHYTVKIIKK